MDKSGESGDKRVHQSSISVEDMSTMLRFQPAPDGDAVHTFRLIIGCRGECLGRFKSMKRERRGPLESVETDFRGQR